jgi:hypothetical protein
MIQVCARVMPEATPIELPCGGVSERDAQIQRALNREEHAVIILGIILLVVGYFTGLSILYTIGGILVVIGLILWILGAVGRPVGGRKVWF